MEVHEDAETFCSTVRTASLCCVATHFNECKVLYLAFTVLHVFLYLSGTLMRDRTLSSDANELQIDQPFAPGALHDRRD